ncbi:ORF1 [Grizzly bear anellovirus 1]|nr:ORF1 [Grizzly bear anellovirus 1]
MPYYRRRRRPYRRRYFGRRRHFFRYRHPFYRRWRRRFYHHKRNPPVRAPTPRHIRSWIVQGVEFLGVIGSEISMFYDNPSDDDSGQWRIDIKNVAPNNKMVDYLSKMLPPEDFKNDCAKFPDTEVSYWDFVGGYGQAGFTLLGLIFRIILGFAKTNATLDRAQLIKYLGVEFQLQRAPEVNYLFLAQFHRNWGDYMKKLIHPINLLCTPGTVTVNSINRTKCCKSPRVRRKADPTLAGWHDLEDFMRVHLISYMWTTFNPSNPMGRNPWITKTIKSPIENNWMNEHKGKNISDYCPHWAARDTYDSNFVENINKIQAIDKTSQSWWEWINQQTIKDQNSVQCAYGKYSPFTPPMLATTAPQTIWMKYKFFFKIAGKSAGFERQNWPIREADTCTICKPSCKACIVPERDLEDPGFLTEKAFKRITKARNPRKKRILEIITRLILERSRKRKRVRWRDQQNKKQKTIISMGLTNTHLFH